MMDRAIVGGEMRSRTEILSPGKRSLLSCSGPQIRIVPQVPWMYVSALSYQIWQAEAGRKKRRHLCLLVTSGQVSDVSHVVSPYVPRCCGGNDPWRIEFIAAGRFFQSLHRRSCMPVPLPFFREAEAEAWGCERRCYTDMA